MIMTVTLTYDDVRNMHWPEDEFPRLVRKLGGKKRWKSRPVSFLEMSRAGICPHDITRIAVLYIGNAEYRRRQLLWQADCAAHSLHFFLNALPAENAPVEAIKAARAFARGAIDRDAFHAAQNAVYTTSSHMPWNTAAWYAAHAAACAGMPVNAVIATGNTVAGVIQFQDQNIMKQEAYWQVERLIARMSESEPEDWPLDWQEAA